MKNWQKRALILPVTHTRNTQKQTFEQIGSDARTLQQISLDWAGAEISQTQDTNFTRKYWHKQICLLESPGLYPV